jgi:hypothetical protein
LRVVRLADGARHRISLEDLRGRYRRNVSDATVFSLAVSDDSQKIAVGLGNPEGGTVGLFDLQRGTQETVLEGLPRWPDSLKFLGSDHLLTTGRELQLWNVPEAKPVWSVHVAGFPVRFDHRPGSPCALLWATGNRLTVFRPEDGQICRQSGVVGAALVGDGRLALELGSNLWDLRLVDTASGRVHVHFSAFPGGTWIARIGNGRWDGSEGLHEQVRFFRGMELMSPEAVEGYRDRQAILTALPERP